MRAILDDGACRRAQTEGPVHEPDEGVRVDEKPHGTYFSNPGTGSSKSSRITKRPFPLPAFLSCFRFLPCFQFVMCTNSTPCMSSPAMTTSSPSMARSTRLGTFFTSWSSVASILLHHL